MNRQELDFLLHKYNIAPRREQGQNFLLDDQVIESIIAAAQLQPTDTVLEIGPGFGVLTQALATRVKRVVAVEQDRVLFGALQTLVKQYPNVELCNEDIRTFYLAQHGLHHQKYLLVANLPYSVTSWIMRHFTEDEPAPQRIVTMVQKEVAERMIAKPGQMSMLSLAVQLYTEPSIVRIVPRTSFYPVPEVDSAVIRLERRATPLSQDPKGLLKIAKMGFSSKRKQLHNTLQTGLQCSDAVVQELLKRAQLKTNARPQELSIEQWEVVRIAAAELLS